MIGSTWREEKAIRQDANAASRPAAGQPGVGSPPLTRPERAGGKGWTRGVITDVIFDLDDTLCDFRGARERGIAGALALLPAEIRPRAADLWRRTEPQFFAAFAAGVISRDTYRWLRFHTVLAELGFDPADEGAKRRLIAAMNFSFMAEINERIVPTDGAEACLHALIDSGVRCHILTNGPSDSQRRRLGRLGFDALLAHVLIGEELGSFKPDPAAFHAARDLIGRPASQIVMIGDDLQSDILPARAAGLHAVHYAPAGSSFRPSIRRLREVADVISGLSFPAR